MLHSSFCASVAGGKLAVTDANLVLGMVAATCAVITWALLPADWLVFWFKYSKCCGWSLLLWLAL
jgi:hypothetical protein